MSIFRFDSIHSIHRSFIPNNDDSSDQYVIPRLLFRLDLAFFPITTMSFHHLPTLAAATPIRNPSNTAAVAAANKDVCTVGSTAASSRWLDDDPSYWHRGSLSSTSLVNTTNRISFPSKRGGYWSIGIKTTLVAPQ